MSCVRQDENFWKNYCENDGQPYVVPADIDARLALANCSNREASCRASDPMARLSRSCASATATMHIRCGPRGRRSEPRCSFQSWQFAVVERHLPPDKLMYDAIDRVLDMDKLPWPEPDAIVHDRAHLCHTVCVDPHLGAPTDAEHCELTVGSAFAYDVLHFFGLAFPDDPPVVGGRESISA